MKVKVMSGVLIFSLAFNLAVIGTFVFKRFLDPEPRFSPRERMERMPFFKGMDFGDTEREKIIELFKEFRKASRETQRSIIELEDQLFETLKDENKDLDQAHKIMEQIGAKKIELGKSALDQFLKAKSFLSPEQQNHFYRMLKQRLGRKSDGKFKGRKRRMEDRQNNNNENIN